MLGRVRQHLETWAPSRLRLLLAAIVVLFFVGLITRGSFAGSGDAAHYMVLAQSLAFDRDLAVADDYGPDSLIQNGRLQPEGHVQPGRGGVLRSVHDVGLPLLAAPAFAVAYEVSNLTERLPEGWRRRLKLDRWIALRQLVSLGMILTSSLLAILVFDVCQLLTGEKARSFLWALLWAISPPILSHASVFFTEIPSALVALAAYAVLLGGKNRGRMWVAGGLAGALLLLHSRNLGLALGLLGVGILRLREESAGARAFAFGFATLLASRLALNLHLWGHLLTSPHARIGDWPGWVALVSEAATRLTGLHLDQSHGLLPAAPVYLLAPAGWLLLRRRAPRPAAETALLVGAYLLPVLLPMTNVHGWQGGWSPAARFLVPVVPFLALGGPLLLANARGRLAAGAVAAVQLLLDGFYWRRPMLLWAQDSGASQFNPAVWGLTLVGAGVLTVWIVRRPSAPDARVAARP
jgi:hypothetical protein